MCFHRSIESDFYLHFVCSQEEAGITADLEYYGTLFFMLENEQSHAFNIEVFKADKFTGTITESVVIDDSECVPLSPCNKMSFSF